MEVVYAMRKKFLADESGAVAIEYVLIAALIALMIVTGARALGTTLQEKMNSIASRVAELID